VFLTQTAPLMLMLIGRW